MALTAASGRKTRSRDTAGSDWTDPEEPARDWKKLFLVAGLGILSWVATYVGMMELIEANVGELPVAHKVIIAFSVAMLMTMIIWLLDQLFAPIGLFTKVVYSLGYLFLTVISVGFGFGFYWKVLESKGEGTRVAEMAIGQVQAPLQTAAARLETLQRTLDQLKTTSQQKAEQERTQGTSCPNSRPGDGPRRKLREDDAARFSFASDFVKGRIDGVKADIAGLEADLLKITKDDRSIVDAKTGTRNEFMRQVNRKLDGTVTSFNAFRGDAQLKQIRTELADRAEKSQFVDTAGKAYSCPDPGLQTMIRSVVASVDALPMLDKPKIATVEGSDATIEAFRRLTASFYGLLSLKLTPSADELRDLQKKAVASLEAGQTPKPAVIEGAGLSKRDYVPLAIAIFVDLCLLLVSMGRPVNRMQSLVPKMRQAERGPVYQILSRFTDIHKDPDIRQNFEIFRHVVFDFNGAYYVAIPLDAPARANPTERRELQLEAHLLSNLFASFEQEKIFSRVYAPLLSTKQIQKKLWRQGSKFAHSEAFRIYKFRDGAWSEIILGAVMGAARRVEAEKQRQRVEDAAFRAANPTLPLPPQSLPASATVLPFPPAHGAPRPMPAAAAFTTMSAGAMPPMHAGAAPSPMAQPAPAASSPTGPGSWAPRPPARTTDASLEAQFGPYAQFQPVERINPSVAGEPVARSAARRTEAAIDDVEPVREPKVGEALVAVQAANSNTAPSRPRVEPVRSVAEVMVDASNPMSIERLEPRELPSAGPTGVDVELTERTVRFTVPHSEASLPASLTHKLGTLFQRQSGSTESADADRGKIGQSRVMSSEASVLIAGPSRAGTAG
jgi:hypothetical protein